MDQSVCCGWGAQRLGLGTVRYLCHVSIPGIGASDRHERMLLERVQIAQAKVDRADAEAKLARERRDAAIRAAVQAGIAPLAVTEQAQVSRGLVSRIVNAPRP